MAVTPKPAKTKASTSVRIEADLYEAAKVTGSRESRSAAQQIDYWARLGRHVSLPGTAARMRIEAAVAGELDFRDLSSEERTVANAEIDAAIDRRATSTNIRDKLLAEGKVAVSMDGDGNIVEYRPDGTSKIIG